MTRTEITKYTVAKKRGPKSETVYKSPRIYLPTKLTSDSAFPFQEGEELLIKIVGRRLVITRLPRRLRRSRTKAGKKRELENE